MSRDCARAGWILIRAVAGAALIITASFVPLAKTATAEVAHKGILIEPNDASPGLDRVVDVGMSSDMVGFTWTSMTKASLEVRGLVGSTWGTVDVARRFALRGAGRELAGAQATSRRGPGVVGLRRRPDRGAGHGRCRARLDAARARQPSDLGWWRRTACRRGHAAPTHHAAQWLGCGREPSLSRRVVRVEGRFRRRAPHRQLQLVRAERQRGADPRHLLLPHAGQRLVRHRIQLPHRPLRAGSSRVGTAASTRRSSARTPAASTPAAPVSHSSEASTRRLSLARRTARCGPCSTGSSRTTTSIRWVRRHTRLRTATATASATPWARPCRSRRSSGTATSTSPTVPASSCTTCYRSYAADVAMDIGRQGPAEWTCQWDEKSNFGPGMATRRQPDATTCTSEATTASCGRRCRPRHRPARGARSAGFLTSDPDVASRGRAESTSFARGGDGALWHRGVHGEWLVRLGVARRPALVVAECCVLGTEPHRRVRLRHRRRALGAQLDRFGVVGLVVARRHPAIAAPDAASDGGGHLDVIARGVNGSIYVRSFRNGAWSGWDSTAGGATSGPGAASWGVNRIDAFIRGVDGALWGSGVDRVRRGPTGIRSAV